MQISRISAKQTQKQAQGYKQGNPKAIPQMGADKVTFGMHPTTKTLLALAEERRSIGKNLKNIFKVAAELFEQSNIKLATNTAIELDSKYRGPRFLGLTATEKLIKTATKKVIALSDDIKENRKLKEKLLVHCYGDNAGLNVEAFFTSLDNKIYGELKQSLISKGAEREEGLLIFSNINAVTKDIGDENFRETISQKYKKQLRLYATEGNGLMYW